MTYTSDREVRNGDIAIIGMACVFPGAPTLERFRNNLIRGVDAVSEIPPSRRAPAYYDPSSRSVDRFYCRTGGFIQDYAVFDPVQYGIMPVAALGAEPEQMLSLEMAARAISDAGYDLRSLPADRVGVVIGRGGYLNTRTCNLNDYVRTAEQLAECVRSLLPGISERSVADIKAEFQSKLSYFGPDTAIGLVPNLTASRIANRLNLKGPAFTVDAACASSLLAIRQARYELISGHCDLVIAGGVYVGHDLTLWSVFTQLGALSRSGVSRPFDRRADGLVIGEGVGLVVLKRLRDAKRDEDRVYAVIRGIGVSSDGREASLMTPSTEGQVLALERAWEDSRLSPETLGLLEAHGTGTPAGDTAELATIRAFFGPKRQFAAGLGSVKSMIGHTMPAAGIAGLIKTALAIHHAFLPPTLHCEQPHPLVEETRFRLLGECEDWAVPVEHRRAAVSAFGFGGINVHVVLEGDSRLIPHKFNLHSVEERKGTDFLFLAGESPAQLIRSLERHSGGPEAGPCRMVVLDPTPERRQLARKIAEHGRRWSGRLGIWFTPAGFAGQGAKTVFLFPGVDAREDPQIEGLAAHFGFPFRAPGGEGIVEHSLRIFQTSRLIHRILDELRVEADALAGHSLGEWTAMVLSGILSAEDVDAFIGSTVPGLLKTPAIDFAAAACQVTLAEEILHGTADVFITHDNCPHQVLMAGAAEGLEEAAGRFAARGVLYQKLPFRSGFHSPVFASYLDVHAANLGRFKLNPPRMPFWSATDLAPYPDTPDAIRDLFVRHLTNRVRFRELALRLYAEGFRVFIQVGGGPLIGFVRDTLKGEGEFAAIPSIAENRTGVDQLLRLTAELWCEGYCVDLSRLGIPEETVRVSDRRALKLELGNPLVRLSPLKTGEWAADKCELDSQIQAMFSPEVAAEYSALRREIASAPGEILAAVAARAASTAAARVEQRLDSQSECSISRRMRFSLEEFPEVIDHSFFRQPNGWPVTADFFPVMPIMGTLALMIRLAEEMAPGMVPVSVESIQARRWLVLDPPTELDVSARIEEREWVDVKVGDFASCRVRMAGRFPTPKLSAAQPFPEGARPDETTAAGLYAERKMFHGPAYQVVQEIGLTHERGIQGKTRVTTAVGSALDGVGQLFGHWLHENLDSRRLVLPSRIERISLFGPFPAVGTLIECDVRVTDIGTKSASGDFDLLCEGRLWASIEGWEDHRFDLDNRMFEVFRFPEKLAYAEEQAGGWFAARESWFAPATRDMVARRYLNQAELAVYFQMSGARKRDWLCGRIAAKDAIRMRLWKNGHGDIFPAELTIMNSEAGLPVVSGPSCDDLRVSIAHKKGVGVALIGWQVSPGIDIESIEPRSEEFMRLVLHEDDFRLLPETNRDEWLTRIWVAKEAVGKCRGTGLKGNPSAFRVERSEAEIMVIDSVRVCTLRYGDLVVGWTEAVQ